MIILTIQMGGMIGVNSSETGDEQLDRACSSAHLKHYICRRKQFPAEEKRGGDPHVFGMPGEQPSCRQRTSITSTEQLLKLNGVVAFKRT
jgi:hypothetical protein